MAVRGSRLARVDWWLCYCCDWL